MKNTYMIGNNVTFSTQWNTTCTRDYGDCGFVTLCFPYGNELLISLHLDVTIATVNSRIFPQGWMKLEIA